MVWVSSKKVEEAYSLVSLIFSFSVLRSVFKKWEWFSIKNKKTNPLSFTKKINVGKWMLKYTSIHEIFSKHSFLFIQKTFDFRAYLSVGQFEKIGEEGAASWKVISFIDIFKKFDHLYIQAYIVETSIRKLDVYENQVSEGYQKKCSFSYTSFLF